MRIVTYGAACSLDGFIAPPDSSMDWLHFSRDVQEFMNTYWASIDTMLMGRKTWEAAMAMGGAGGGGMGGITTYIFSRTLASVGQGAELVLSLIHISEPTRLLSISYAVFCLKK